MTTHAIILNFKRPQNIRRIVEACFASGAVDQVHVIDQAADGETAADLPAGDRIVHIRRPNIGAGRRLIYGLKLVGERIIAIDDDVFLTPEQIAGLLERAAADPARVHGIGGQDMVVTDNKLTLSFNVRGVDRPVDILNRVYAFSPAQAKRALALAQMFGFGWQRLTQVDDIFMSVAAAEKPMCHDLGEIESCPTSNEDGTAISKQPGFYRARLQLVGKLRAAGLM